MNSLSTLCLLIGIQLATGTFWPFVPGPNPFASLFPQPAAQPTYQQPAVQQVYQQPAVQQVYQQPAVQQVYQQPAQQVYQQVQQTPCGCCSGRKRRQAVIEADSIVLVDPTCKNQQLRTLMLENISSSTEESTRAVQHAAKELGDFDVVCAKGDFSYAVHSNLFCQAKVDDVTCYAFYSQY